MIGTLCENLDTLDDSEAKASMIWVVGEYADRIDNAGPPPSRWRVTTAHVRQSRPDSGPGVRVKVCQLFQVVPSSFDTMDDSRAKASMIWVVGEYADRIDNAGLSRFRGEKNLSGTFT